MSIEYIYSNTPVHIVKVKLDGKVVGNIVQHGPKSFQYVPKGQVEGGDFYTTLALCQQSLEAA